jgi:hypothetical protein
VLLLVLSPVLLIHSLAIALLDRTLPWRRTLYLGSDDDKFTGYSLRAARLKGGRQRLPAAHRRHLLKHLPRLLNVIRGNMSLIGPAPQAIDETDIEVPTGSSIRPGFTGLHQLSRVWDKSADAHPEYDRFYELNSSFGLDLWILWRTLLFLLLGRHAGLRLAVSRWERDPSWREGLPPRLRAIPQRRKGFPRLRTAWAVAALVVAVLPGLVTSLQARQDLEGARRALLEARRAAQALQPELANLALTKGQEDFDRADRRLHSWTTWGIGAIPGLNNNLQVARDIADTGDLLVESGREGLSVLQGMPIRDGKIVAPFKDGVLDIAPLREARQPADRMLDHIARARRQVAGSPTLLLFPSVAAARRNALETLQQAEEQAEIAAGAAFLLPRIFGGDGPKRWVLGAENSSELRGRGGFVGSFGILTADQGRASLENFTSITTLPPISGELSILASVDPEYARQYAFLGGLSAWANTTMSPDFNKAGALFLARLEPALQQEFDGMITLDPTGLSYLLKATGPVQVEGIEEAVTADNIVNLSLNELYFRFEDDNPDRRELLTDIAAAVWGRVFNSPDLNPRALFDALARSASERRMVMYAVDPEEQKAIERLGLAGRVEQGPDDYLLLLAQNFGENKADYYLTRHMTYTGSFDHDGNLDARLSVRVHNTAPKDAPLPSYIAGERERIELDAGISRSFFSLFVPDRAQLRGLIVDGTPSGDVDNSLELGRRRLGHTVELRAGESTTFTYIYRIPNAIRDGRYRLVVQNQSTVISDELAIRLTPPPGASIEDRETFGRGEELVWEGKADRTIEFSAGIRTSALQSMMRQMTDWLSRPVGGAGRER